MKTKIAAAFLIGCMSFTVSGEPGSIDFAGGEPDFILIPTQVSISPPTGTYYSTQNLDLVVRVDYDMALFTTGSIMYDGYEVAGDLSSCWIVGTGGDGTYVGPFDSGPPFGGLDYTSSTYRCPLNTSDLGEGEHTLYVKLNFSDGRSFSDSVVWTIEHIYE